MNEFAWLSRTELIVGREGLEKLATKVLKNDERLQQLKSKSINTDFLKLF